MSSFEWAEYLKGFHFILGQEFTTYMEKCWILVRCQNFLSYHRIHSSSMKLASYTFYTAKNLSRNLKLQKSEIKIYILVLYKKKFTRICQNNY